MTTTPGTGPRLRTRLKLRQLSTLLAIAEAVSLRGAALSLGVSQPAVSKALRDLEGTVGRALFSRTSRGLVPTAHGVVMIDHARRMGRDVEALERSLEAVDRGSSGHLRLGAIPYVSSDWLRRVTTRMVSEEPRIELQLSEGATDRLLAALRAHELDCIVGRITPGNAGRDLVWRPLFEQTLRIVARAGHRLARRGRRLALRNLADAEWVLPERSTPTRRLLEHVFHDAGLAPPQARIETYALRIVESIVGHTDAIAAVPDDIARQFEQRGSIRALHFQWAMPPICLVWLRSANEDPLISRLARAALCEKGAAIGERQGKMRAPIPRIRS